MMADFDVVEVERKYKSWRKGMLFNLARHGVLIGYAGDEDIVTVDGEIDLRRMFFDLMIEDSQAGESLA